MGSKARVVCRSYGTDRGVRQSLLHQGKDGIDRLGLIGFRAGLVTSVLAKFCDEDHAAIANRHSQVLLGGRAMLEYARSSSDSSAVRQCSTWPCVFSFLGCTRGRRRLP
jgi:hypothetical protein